MVKVRNVIDLDSNVMEDSPKIRTYLGDIGCSVQQVPALAIQRPDTTVIALQSCGRMSFTLRGKTGNAPRWITRFIF